ncbi:class I SAM-dependent DNA methyltransferase [Nonomuraea angiospora]|uniref:Ubiquinone/menaquinone biosynthesis C-methylase UbiE n=1 Tax=Nonomuraea angiospora TaxID=46172 RepID=A0ABR9LNQ7_9ACTN|nr:class I SAM-dependent methyltransferase [Nonomuraea angiospora]MBE1582290.1 ubiquinone/menaquinone biosynthesis C-methylase UbiE [Nonomuraea angiospora]
MTFGIDYFEERYKAASDPFLFESRWYEERKRRITLAMLPDQRYDNAFEPGCATGVHTLEFARRCKRVLAADFSGSALQHARRRYAQAQDRNQLGQVDFARLVLPRDWPDEKFDLIAVLETLCYFEPSDYREFVAKTVDSLIEGGILLLAHWRPHDDTPLSADEVHRGFAEQPDLVLLSRHEEQFLLELYGKGSAETFRARPGLVAEVEVRQQRSAPVAMTSDR